MSDKQVLQEKVATKRTVIKKMPRVLLACLVFLLVLLISGGVYFEYYSVDTSVKPSVLEQGRVRDMLNDYVKKRWGDRVYLKKFGVGQEYQSSDFPANHTWKEYQYFAYLQIRGTSVVFFASLPLDVRQDELKERSMLGSKLTDNEVELLKAYSMKIKTPASIWYKISGNKNSKQEIWSVTPVVLGNSFSMGYTSYEFERLPNGTYRFFGR